VLDRVAFTDSTLCSVGSNKSKFCHPAADVQSAVRGKVLNLAVVKLTAVQLTKLPL
jgi:hypothetical protein